MKPYLFFILLATLLLPAAAFLGSASTVLDATPDELPADRSSSTVVVELPTALMRRIEHHRADSVYNRGCGCYIFEVEHTGAEARTILAQYTTAILVADTLAASLAE